ncbi:DUF2293 domain-containing protein [Terrihabitans sp. B22-R8]|uniref:DUF2293 domain-containing protein n=1 Tax=Terrihabitans sp. B22-R8 TaxID=3425128 RepID=UPI00403C707E
MASRRAIEEALRHLAPDIPDFEFGAVTDHAVTSPGLGHASPENAVWLSMTAYIRHALADYDDLLADGYDRDSARHFVFNDINERLAEWGVKRRLSEDD